MDSGPPASIADDQEEGEKFEWEVGEKEPDDDDVVGQGGKANKSSSGAAGGGGAGGGVTSSLAADNPSGSAGVGGGEGVVAGGGVAGTDLYSALVTICRCHVPRRAFLAACCMLWLSYRHLDSRCLGRTASSC